MLRETGYIISVSALVGMHESEFGSKGGIKDGFHSGK